VPCSPLQNSGSVRSSLDRASAPCPSRRGIVQSRSACSQHFVVRQLHCASVLAGDHLKTETFIRRSRIGASAGEVYAWHALPGVLEKLTPPGEHAKILERTGGIESGARVVIQFGRWPFRQRWVAEHRDLQEGRYFSDVQISGPFAYWKHTHTFEPDGRDACILEDRVEYALPFGALGRWLAGWYARRTIEQLFEYRHGVTMREFTRETRRN
jgi:ligand-binding SRPBCC domain-containing protein